MAPHLKGVLNMATTTEVTTTPPSAAATKQPPRACLFNLVAYAPDQERLPRLLKIVQTFGTKFPCRLILISHTDEKSGVRVETSPCSCLRQKNGYEQVFIYVDEEGIDKVPFLVLPYLIPDLPTYLLWDQDPTLKDNILDYLKKFSTRIIFDASTTEDLSSFAKRMTDMLPQSSIDKMDLSWALISSWRDTLALLFNDEKTLEDLRYCKKIRILCNHASDHAGGIYLLSWLATQLGWKFIVNKLCEGVIETTFSHAKGNVATAISEQPNHSPEERGIASIEIVTASGVVYQITHRPSSRTIVAHIIHDNCCDLPITLPFAGLNQSFSFMKELLHNRSSTHYKNMLAMLSQFPKQNHS